MLQFLTANLSGSVRRETREGREYIVAPLSMIVPGVLNGSKGPLYYPPEEISRDPDAWNGMPIVIGHPTDNEGKPVSARRPDVVSIGTVFNSGFSDKLSAEGWFDIEQTRKADSRIFSLLERGDPIELSTGLFTDNEPVKNKEYNGKPYTAVARNYKPDHLAVFADKTGACSVKDGCGVNVNQEATDDDLKPYKLDWDDDGAGAEKKWFELVSNAKAPSRSLDMSPEKACKILKDGYVHGKPLTNQQRGMFGALCGKRKKKSTSNKESNMPLNEQQKEEIIDNLISNEGLDYDGPWDEEDRQALNAMNDEKLIRLNEARETAVENMTDMESYEDDDSAAKKGAKMDERKKHKKKKMKANQAADDDCDDCDDDAVNNQKSMTDDEWLASAPAGIRSVVQNAMNFEQRQKEKLIKVITSNERNRFTKDYLKELSIDELNGVAALAANKEQEEEEQRRQSGILLPNYSGVPGVTANLGEDFSKEDHEMAPQPMDWGKQE